MKNILIFLAMCLLLLNTVIARDDADELFNDGKEYTAEREWQKAIDKFQELIDNYPQSRYHDDALFWIGYCLENREQSKVDAYLTYGQLTSKFPESTWKDDAIIHQLDLAALFVLQGQVTYRSFIQEQTTNPIPYIARKSQEILEELDNRAQDSLAIQQIPEDAYSLSMEALYDKLGLTSKESAPDEDDFLFFPTERYTQYRSLLRNDDKWSQEELFDFGMWTILKDEQMSSYFALSGYDRREWFRKYWAQKDPTPTTPENEALEEFKRRVVHAKSYFGTLVDYKHLKFLRDQDLRRDWFHAPWDARGELYVKYGEPDFSTINDFRKDEWLYNGLHADFLINHHMTNIYGNAITAGPYSIETYGENIARVNFDYIFNNEFRYIHNYDREPIEDARMDIRVNPNNHSEIIVLYSLPFEEFEFNENDQIQYKQTYIVFNEDMSAVQQLATVETIRYRGNDTFTREIKLLLAPGAYRFALRIEDLNSDKLGIYSQNFSVKAKD
ncbi:MAG: GWxTD domain-containing protein [Calditrichaeota bacterium]|nr:GWxTD domain-containing protein [Calditrichota bacterium]